MGRGVLSEVAYRGVAEKAKKEGSATFAGEQRRREGKGLHPLVDPSGYDVIRRSLSWLEPEGDHFVLLRGVSILEETRLDTTGSMGNNVEIAMAVLPKTYKLLATGSRAVLKRYDVQMITSIFGDVVDDYVLCRSQAEMDERIAEQMTLMYPEHGGGDHPEDPQYGLFGGAYLTSNSINQYGLKGYDFTISDAPGRHRLSHETLVRIFGKTVFEKVAENGYQINEKNLPDTSEVVQDLLKRTHAFFLQVGPDSAANRFWTQVFGKERVVVIPRTELLPEAKAAIIGLTESTLDLQNLEDFLLSEVSVTGEDFVIKGSSKLNRQEVVSIKRAVAGIPISAQAALPNFSKIPLKGAEFAKKGDVWPIGYDSEGNPEAASEKKPNKKKKKEDMWL